MSTTRFTLTNSPRFILEETSYASRRTSPQEVDEEVDEAVDEVLIEVLIEVF